MHRKKRVQTASIRIWSVYANCEYEIIDFSETYTDIAKDVLSLK